MSAEEYNNHQNQKKKAELSEKQKKEIKEAFDLFDSDSTGIINTKTLKPAMKALGFDPPKEEIRNIIAEVDKSGEGIIKYDDFLNIMTQKFLERDPVEEIRKEFHLLCEEGQDKITLDTLLKIANESGEELTIEELKEILLEGDWDGDGDIGEEDYVKIMKKARFY